MEGLEIRFIPRQQTKLSDEMLAVKKRLRERLDLQFRGRYKKLIEVCEEVCDRRVKDLSELTVGELNRVSEVVGSNKH